MWIIFHIILKDQSLKKGSFWQSFTSDKLIYLKQGQTIINVQIQFYILKFQIY